MVALQAPSSEVLLTIWLGLSSKAYARLHMRLPLLPALTRVRVRDIHANLVATLCHI